MEAGGAQGAAVRNSRYFSSKGIDSSVVFLYTKRDIYVGEDIISLAAAAPKNIVQLFSILAKLYRLIRSTKNAKVICYTHYANVIGAFVSFVAGSRNIVVSHRNPVETYPKLCRVIDRIIGFTPIYHRCICVSKTVVESFSHYPSKYRSKIRLVYNGVDTQEYMSSSEDKKFEWIRDRAGDRLVLLSTGRLHPQKNQIVLLKAMVDVQDCFLVIAGEGELRPEFERFIKENNLAGKVVLLGEIPPQDVSAFLKVGDVFLFPSNYEAFGFSVVEAMASALPIVCSDIPAMREIVGETGILLDKDSPSAWSNVISSLSRKRLKEMSYNSKERAKRYSLEEMAEQYLETLANAD